MNAEHILSLSAAGQPEELPYAEQEQKQKVSKGCHADAEDEFQNFKAGTEKTKQMFQQINTSYGQKECSQRFQYENVQSQRRSHKGSNGTDSQQAQKKLAGEKSPENSLYAVQGHEQDNEQDPDQNGSKLVKKSDGCMAEAVKDAVQVTGQIENRADPGEGDEEFSGKLFMK